MNNNLRLKTTVEDQLLFACTRQTFLAAHHDEVLDICRNRAVNWDIVYTIAAVHGVAPLVYVNLLQCCPTGWGMPQPVGDQFKHNLASNMVYKAKRAKKTAEVLAFCNSKAIDIMLIKGAALEMLVYHQPWYTVSNDVDFIVKAKWEALPEADRRALWTIRRGLPSECDFFEHHDVMMGGTLAVDFDKIWTEASQVNFRGHDVFVMAPEDMLMALCINSCRKRYFRLKALCDIAETINAYRDLNWEKLTAQSRVYGCNMIVYPALLIPSMTLGSDLPEGVLADLAVSSRRKQLIGYLSQGILRSSLTSLYSGRRIIGRPLDLSLLLQYATLYWRQVWRRRTRIIRKRPHSELELNIPDLAKP